MQTSRTKTDQNHRQFYRLDVTMTCQFRLRTIGTKTLATGEMFEGIVQNISGGGLAFSSIRDLPISPLLSWQVLVELEGEKLNLLGNLVWKSVGRGIAHYGMKFILVEDSQRQRLLSKIVRLQMLQRQRDLYSTTS